MQVEAVCDLGEHLRLSTFGLTCFNCGRRHPAIGLDSKLQRDLSLHYKVEVIISWIGGGMQIHQKRDSLRLHL